VNNDRKLNLEISLREFHNTLLQSYHDLGGETDMAASVN
jgi:hypothetical protein